MSGALSSPYRNARPRRAKIPSPLMGEGRVGVNASAAPRVSEVHPSPALPIKGREKAWRQPSNPLRVAIARRRIAVIIAGHQRLLALLRAAMGEALGNDH